MPPDFVSGALTLDGYKKLQPGVPLSRVPPVLLPETPSAAASTLSLSPIFLKPLPCFIVADSAMPDLYPSLTQCAVAATALKVLLFPA